MPLRLSSIKQRISPIKRKHALWASALLLAIWGVICVLTNDDSDEEVLSGCAFIDGSGSAHHLGWLVGREFMTANGSSLVSVGLGGSNRGIQRLIDGEVDIALSSRELTDEEEDARPESDEFEVQVIAYDHVAIVVNKKFPVSSLSVEQLKEGLTAPEWTVNGTRIHRFLPSESSGTRTFLARKLKVEATSFHVDPDPTLPRDGKAAQAAFNLYSALELVGKQENSMGILSISQLPLIEGDSAHQLKITSANGTIDKSPSLFLRPLNMISLPSRLDRNPVARALYEQTPDLILTLPGVLAKRGDAPLSYLTADGQPITAGVK